MLNEEGVCVCNLVGWRGSCMQEGFTYVPCKRNWYSYTGELSMSTIV